MVRSSWLLLCDDVSLFGSVVRISVLILSIHIFCDFLLVCFLECRVVLIIVVLLRICTSFLGCYGS